MNLAHPRVLPWVAAFAGVDTLVDADLVGDGSAAGSEGSADEGSLASAGDCSDNCATRCGAADDLGAGVMAMIMGALGVLGAFMLIVALGYAGERHCKQTGEGEKGSEFGWLHGDPHFVQPFDWMRCPAIRLGNRVSHNEARGELVFAGRSGAFFWLGGVGLEAFVRNEHGVRDLLGGSAGKGAVEAGDVDAALAHLGFDGGVHGGEKLVAEFVEDAVDVDVGQRALLQR